MTVTIGGIEFDHVVYDRGGDVLYLHRGDPANAVEFDETPEGHHVRLDSEDRVVGLTLIRPKSTLAMRGEIRVTLPVAERVEAVDLDSVLS